MKWTSRILSTAVARGLFCGLTLVGLAGPAAQHSVATLITLTDKNSVAQFDTATPANNYNWFVDGVDQLAQQAFWYRIGNASPEQSVHSLPIVNELASNTNFNPGLDTLDVIYDGGGFQIETVYHLHGALAGTGSSDMGEDISINNLTGSPLDFHFFQYANFDLSNTPGGDAAQFTNQNTVRQFQPGSELTETVATPVPSHREIAFFPITLNKLNDGAPTTLSDTPPFGVVVGPGDMTWAYQWDAIIAPNSTFQISKDKNLSLPPAPVPEPAAGSLLCLAVGLLLARCRKRRIA